jgi:hypothetical protein
MSLISLVIVTILALGALGVMLIGWIMRRQTLDRWLVPYLVQATTRSARAKGGPVHVLLCVADHFEPQWGRPDAATARLRVEQWVQEYPRLFREFRDSDGQAPQHTFFFPIDEYEHDHVEMLAELCRAGFGEVEMHLHHDDDSSESLRARLLEFKELFSERHGLLSRDRRTGELAYGFIHGNWALDNSRPDGRWCGVNNELDILRETGCYADFTLPSAPSPTQTRKINSIYYASDDPVRPKSHDRGIDVGTSPAPPGALLLIQGPLVLNWRRRKWGLAPRVENGCLQANQPPRIDRLDLWVRARVQVPARPDWYFVKVYTHGAPEANHRVLLGEPMTRFHFDLRQRASVDLNFHYHYVTAREMYNLVKAAEAGWQGSVADARDFQLIWQRRDAGERQAAMSSANRAPGR